MVSADLIPLFTQDIVMILAVVCFIAAIISAIVGTIGGMMIVVVGAFFVPFELWLPIHASVQCFANGSRLYMGREHLEKKICFEFAGGSTVGTLLGTSVVAFASQAVVLTLGNTFILISTWIKMIAFNFKFGFSVAGFIHGFLGGMIGSPGPIAMPTLLHRYGEKDFDKTIVNHAFFAMSSHTLRVLGFGLWGYNYLDVWQFIAIFAAVSIVGTYLGTAIRHNVGNKQNLSLALKIILSIMVVYNIIKYAPALWA